MKNLVVIGLTFGASVSVSAQSILFDFDNAPVHTSLPISLTVDALTANFSATGQGFSIQSANALGFTPQGFAGLCIYPNSVFAADLIVSFSDYLTSFSIMYAPEEYATDSSARMRVTAYNGATVVGTATTTAPNPGTWPTGVLSYANSTDYFNKVVVHYDAPPPTGGDWGPIFMADNMTVSTAPVPEPVSLLAIATGIGSLLLRKRRD